MTNKKMLCPRCKKEMLETIPRVFYCQSQKCQVAYVILQGSGVYVKDIVSRRVGEKVGE